MRFDYNNSHMPTSSKLGLGTVQFGLDYGVSNTRGRTPPEEVAAILKEAYLRGVRVVDTAAGYGDSEAVLGEHLQPAPDWRIVTKTFPWKRPGDVGRGLESSLARLRRPSVEALLARNADELLGPRGPEVHRELLRAKEDGMTLRVGAAAYNAAQIDSVLALGGLDIVQVPVSVLDQRLIASGHLRKLKEKGIEVHARSAFLQGALLMDPAVLPEHLAHARDRFEAFRRAAAERALTPLEAALSFVIALPEVDTVVCGVESPAHFSQLLKASERRTAAGDWKSFAIADEAVLNPALWTKAAA